MEKESPSSLFFSQLKKMDPFSYVMMEVVSTLDLPELHSLIVSRVGEFLRYERCALYQVEENELVLKTTYPPSIGPQGMKIGIGEGIPGMCAESRSLVRIGEVSRTDFAGSTVFEDTGSVLAVPLLHENRVMGVLCAESSRKNSYNDAMSALLQRLCFQIGVALSNAETFARLQKLAVTDGLTGLYNCRYFLARLEEEVIRVRRYKRELSIIILDLDDFKKVNDVYGHLMGDEILKAVSSLIAENTRRSDSASIMKGADVDTAARYGGEEFMLILPETPLDGALVLAERLRKVIETEVNKLLPSLEEDQEQLRVTGSFGIASLGGNETVKDLIQRADEAMYRAKAAGKNRIMKAL